MCSLKNGSVALAAGTAVGKIETTAAAVTSHRVQTHRPAALNQSAIVTLRVRNPYSTNRAGRALFKSGNKRAGSQIDGAIGTPARWMTGPSASTTITARRSAR